MLTYLGELPVFQVVGSQARILYADQAGRSAIATAFNKAIADGQLQVNACAGGCLGGWVGGSVGGGGGGGLGMVVGRRRV